MSTHTPILDRFFDQWARSAFGPDYRTKLPEIQLVETERAFMSGFASYYFFSMEAVALSDAEAAKKLGAVNEEIKFYFAAIKVTSNNPRSN